jgi:hypothetical protein
MCAIGHVYAYLSLVPIKICFGCFGCSICQIEGRIICFLCLVSFSVFGVAAGNMAAVNVLKILLKKKIEK